MIDAILALKPWINRDLVFPELFCPRGPQQWRVAKEPAKEGTPIDLEGDRELHRELGMAEMRKLMSELAVFKFAHDAIREQVLEEGRPT